MSTAFYEKTAPATETKWARGRCMECGQEGEEGRFHPYAFCVLKKARPHLDPWLTFIGTCKLAGMDTKTWPVKAPHIRDLERVFGSSEEKTS